VHGVLVDNLSNSPAGAKSGELSSPTSSWACRRMNRAMHASASSAWSWREAFVVRSDPKRQPPALRDRGAGGLPVGERDV